MTGTTTDPASATPDEAPMGVPELSALAPKPSTQGYRRPVRLLLWGAGPAHLRFLRSLQKSPIAHAEITLLTQHTQVFSPRLLARFMANECAISQCLTDIEPLVQGNGVRWAGRQGRAMDAASRTVLLDDRQVMEYDVLSINIGAQPHREAVERAIPGAREHGLFVPPIESFVSMWPKVCDMGRSRALRVAVVGHCTMGFELALAVRQRMPTAAVTWVPAPQEAARSYPDTLHQRMLAVLRTQRVTVLYEPVAALERNDVVLASGARLACDVPLLVLSQSTPAWLHDTGLADSAQGSLSLDQHLLTDAYERSTSQPEVFFVQQDSKVLAPNLHASMNAEPDRLRPLQAPSSYFLYAGAQHALMSWRGHCIQGRGVGWLKQYLQT
jgi:NADH dehydrogenase FAD-containing subunit